MKLMIAGSRNLRIEPAFIDLTLRFHGIQDEVEEVVSGGAEGVDWAGEEYSIDYLDQEARVVQADWLQGHSAGPARNKKMAEYADCLLLIWDGKSPGSANMKSEMLKVKKPVYEVIMKAPQ